MRNSRKMVIALIGLAIINGGNVNILQREVYATEIKDFKNVNNEILVNKEFILANIGEGVLLRDISDKDCEFTGNGVEVKDNKLYVSNKGVNEVNVKYKDKEVTVLIVAKEKEEKEYILYEEDFDKIQNGMLPTGWSRLEGNTESKVGVIDGEFIINALKAPDNPSRVMLPQYLNLFSNYRIEADVTFLNQNEGTRWNSIMYRIQENKNDYYQMAVRQNAKASNGVELAQRKSGNWNIIDKGSYSQVIDSSKMYKYKIKIHENRVQEFINDDLIIDTSISNEYKSGGIGLQANGSIMKVDNMKIVLQEETLPKLPYEKYTDVKEINENISLAPTLGMIINNESQLEILKEDVLPGNAIVKINNKLDIINDTSEVICTIDEFLNKIDGKAIPVFEVKDGRTADKLVQYLKENEIEDVSIIAEEGRIIKKIKDDYPIVRGILKFPYEGPLEEHRMLEIVQEANRSKAKTVLLPQNRINGKVTEYMQKRLVTVWGVSDKDSEIDSHQLITAGVNGIITRDYKSSVKALKSYDKNTIVRAPFIIGHRGNPSLAPENTLESAKLSYENGADIIENDIYLTKDNEIVIMHDGTLDRTTNGTGNIENYTLKELKELKVNKQFPDKYPDAKIPTLKEYFKEFKDKDIVHFIEIKSYKPEIVKKLKELVYEMDVQDQVVVISFNEDQIKEMNKVMPEVSVGYLNSLNASTGDVRDNIRKVFKGTQQLNATFNPSYTGINKESLEELKHRGMTVWPWTYRDKKEFINGYKMGGYGLTTDYPQWSSNLVKDIKVSKTREYIKVGDTIEIDAKGIGYQGDLKNIEVSIIQLDNSNKITISDTKVTGKEKGTTTVMLKTIIDLGSGNNYTIYSEPITINIK